MGVTKRGKPNITYKHQIASMLPKLLGTKSKPELMTTEMIEGLAADLKNWRNLVVEASKAFE